GGARSPLCLSVKGFPGASESNDAKSLIFGNHGKAFIRATRPPHRCVISLPCPTCGREVSFLEQYQRYYCYVCGNYAPDGYGDRDAKICPTCRGILSYVGQYNRYYCYRCNAYPPDAEPGPRPRRPTVLLKAFQPKKAAVMDLSKAYELDPAGTKDPLRDRLRSYLDNLDGEAEPQQGEEETAVQTEPVVAEPAAEVEQESSPGMNETVEAPSVEEEPMGEEPVSDSPQAVPTETAETRPLQEPVVEPVETPEVSVSETQQAISVAPAIEPTRALHPCPTCGRELTYIARYRRWYCCHCRPYAPLRESKCACPTCGAALRWIGQYERWWCDSCRRYAPADLPKPEAVAVRASKPAEISKPVSYATAYSTTAITHRHRSPGSGIGLVGFGILLFVVYELLVDLPGALSYTTG